MSTPKDHNQVSLSYKDAGVDIDAGNALVEKIKSTAQATTRPGVLSGLGGFGGLFEMPAGYQQPVLVSGTDGVGTKLRLAIDWQQHQGVGIDLVAMCVNDLIVAGAEPLFFLDYYATGDLDVEAAATVVEGIGKGCEQSGCALVGGETAEMPGMYPKGDYDLAGFCVGVVEKSKILDGQAVKVGDQLIGLASSGPHSNGYSLIRKVLELNATDPDELLDGKPLREHLLEPTRIYVRPLIQLLDQLSVHAMAHITGGGLLENIPRVLPTDCQASIFTNSWQRPAIFSWLQTQGNISDTEMMRTFNNGVGMVLVVPPSDLDMALEFLEQFGEQAWHLGEITAAQDDEQVVFVD